MHAEKKNAPEHQGCTLLRWRTTLGWGLAETAKRLGVTPRTLNSYESGAQEIPKGRWSLFLHEVAKVLRPLRPNEIPVGLVTVNGEDGFTCIDVVSADNYAGLAISDDGKRGLIASYAINRETGTPYLHRQPFLVEVNRHLFKAVEAWDEDRRVQAKDEAVYHMHRWITRMALKGEIDNPDLATLKLEMNEANEKLKAAKDATADDQARLFEAHEAAVAAFVEALARHKPIQEMNILRDQ